MAYKTIEGHIVIIEWDGQIPPTPYYHRLRGLTGGVRGSGNKETSVIGRRTDTESDGSTGLILQEGAIVTPSESLARAIAGTARMYGARDVHIGTVELRTFTELTEEDRQVLNKVDYAFGRRGRPPKPVNWMVSCVEDMESFFVVGVPYVVNCPRCGGLNLISYPSKKPIAYKYVVEKGGERSLINEWLVTRFGSGLFMFPPANEVLVIDEQGTYEDKPYDPYDGENTPYKTNKINMSSKCVTTVDIKSQPDSEIVERIKGSTLLANLEKKASYNDSLHSESLVALDGVFASLRYETEEVRDTMRIRAITHIMSGGYRGHISFSSDPNDVDLLDASGVFTPQRMKTLFNTLGV